jgi:hypothetical protein
VEGFAKELKTRSEEMPFALKGNLLAIRHMALHVTPADEQDRAQVGELGRQVQEITGENVELAYVVQG